jgi:hypothetical protein
MMLKMHVEGEGVPGKTLTALLAGGEEHGNRALVSMRQGPGLHFRNRNGKRNCEDKSNEPPAQYTPSVTHPLVPMHWVTDHDYIYSNSLIWSKAPSVFRP